MTTISPEVPQSRPLSERLTEPLRLVTGRMRILAFLRAGFQWITLIATSWLVLILLLGLFPKLPLLLALPIALLAWAILVFGAIALFRPILKTRDISTAARMVDAAMPDSQERISSAIQLSADPDKQFSGSPELIAVLVRQAEHAAEQLDPNIVVSGRSVALWFGATLPLMLLWFILLLVMTPALFLGIQRLINPFTNVAAAPTATLEIDPKNYTTSQGDQVTIKLTVSSPGNLETKPDVRPSISRHLAESSASQDITGDMERTGPHTFNLFLDNVQQSFTYRISALGNDSPIYTVTVEPRPAASNIKIQYTYPAYTHLPTHTDPSRDGAIDALVGTHTSITIESPEPLTTARMNIADNGTGPETVTLLPDADKLHYTGEFTINKSTQYTLALTSTKNINNKDDQPRPISARTDLPPNINITSPPITLKVRPDDTVPIHFTAGDDFGLTKIDAILQIDNRASTTTIIPLPANQTKLDSKYDLNLTDLFSSLPPSVTPRHVYYTLRATDNRDPNPQTGLSARQTLEIDASTTPLAQREDAAASKDLAAAVKKASADLDAAKKTIDTLRKTAANRPLTEKEKQQAETARSNLAQAADTLKSAAAKAGDSRLTESAQQAKDIADKPIQQAQENTAASELAADQPQARNPNLDKASQNIADARQKLDQLSRQLGESAKDQPLAQNVERLADEQKKLADALALHPNDPKLQQQQRDLQKKLDDLIKKNPELQKPVETANQKSTDDLNQQLNSLQQSQKPLNDQAQSQTDAGNAPAKLNDIARQQQDLNQKIQNFNQQQSQALKNTASHAPDPSQLDPIVRDLQANKPAEANREQNAAANQLDQTASKLESAQKQQTDNAAALQKAADQAAQNAKNADSLKQDTDKLADTIKQAQDAHNPPTRPSDPANKDASNLADQIKKQAQQIAQQSPEQRAAAQDAAQQAAAAKKEAQQGNASAAQQQLASAAQKLSDAAHAQQQSNPAPTSADQNSAAAQARDLANKQQQLADQTAGVNKAIDQSQNASPEQTAKDQQALADQMNKAAQDAQSLSQKTKDGAPDLSQRAQQAAQSLQQAAQSEQEAAKANQQGDTPKATASQQKAAQSLASAQQSITGQSPSQQSPDQKSTASAQQQQSPNQQQSPSQQNPSNSSPNGQQQQSPSAQSSPNNTSQKPGEGQTANSAPSGQQQQSPNGQSSPNSNSSAHQQQSPSAQSSPNTSSQKPGEGQSPNSNSTASGQQQQSPNGQSNASSNPQSSPASSAARAVQNARAAQNQAANGDPDAAHRAAEQLAQASHDLMSNPSQSPSPASSPSPSPSQPQPQPQPQSPGQGQPSADGSAKPDPNAPPGSSSGEGITITAGKHEPTPPPQSVTEVGISPSDWAKLPANLQDQLLHSAQQSGPPAYRDMIKNYYSRIARLQGPAAAGGNPQ